MKAKRQVYPESPPLALHSIKGSLQPPTLTISSGDWDTPNAVAESFFNNFRNPSHSLSPRNTGGSHQIGSSASALSSRATNTGSSYQRLQQADLRSNTYLNAFRSLTSHTENRPPSKHSFDRGSRSPDTPMNRIQSVQKKVEQSSGNDQEYCLDQDNTNIPIEITRPFQSRSSNAHHQLLKPSQSLDPHFNTLDDAKLPIISALITLEHPAATSQVLESLKIQIDNGLYPLFDTSFKICPQFQSQIHDQIKDQVFELSLTTEGRTLLASQIASLTITQVNYLIFYIAKIGDAASLKTLAKLHNLDFNLRDNEQRTAAFYAAVGNHVKCLQILSKNGTMLDLIDSSGRTPLLWACYYGCKAATAYLLKKSGPRAIHHQDFQNRTALHCATFPEKSITLSLILRTLKIRQGIDFLDEEQMTPLMWASFYGNTENVKMLLKATSNPYLKDIEGKTALHWSASSNKHSGVVKTLVRHDLQLAEVKDNLGRYALHIAAGEGNCAIVGALIKAKITKIGVRDDLRRTPLHCSSVNGHVACMKLLCDRGANLDKVDHYGASALHYAAEKNFADCVHVLIKKGASVDVKDEAGQTPLHWCASEGASDVVKMLIEAEVSIDMPDSVGLTALHLAAFGGHTALCVFLIQHGASVHNADSKLHTPLFRAVIGGSSDCTLALINEGANVNSTDIHGRYPLHWAALAGHLDVVQILLCYGANPNSTDMSNIPPLHEAAYEGHIIIVSSLQEYGALMNAKDELGVTALHRAASMGHLEICRILIANKVSINALDSLNQESPFDYCVKNAHYKCSQYLTSVGGMTKFDVLGKSARTIQKYWRGYRRIGMKQHRKHSNANETKDYARTLRNHHARIAVKVDEAYNPKETNDRNREIEIDRSSLAIEREKLLRDQKELELKRLQFLQEQCQFEERLEQSKKNILRHASDYTEFAPRNHSRSGSIPTKTVLSAISSESSRRDLYNIHSTRPLNFPSRATLNDKSEALVNQGQALLQKSSKYAVLNGGFPEKAQSYDTKGLERSRSGYNSSTTSLRKADAIYAASLLMIVPKAIDDANTDGGVISSEHLATKQFGKLYLQDVNTHLLLNMSSDLSSTSFEGNSLRNSVDNVEDIQ